jgi:hypothetical protein
MKRRVEAIIFGIIWGAGITVLAYCLFVYETTK